MVRRTVTLGVFAAALAALSAVQGTACGGELEETYHAELLERGLFSVAEGASLRILRDPEATPARKQIAAVRLADALAQHGRFADGTERTALFERAEQTLAAASRAHPDLPAIRTDLAAAQVAATRALLAGRDALPDLRPSADAAAAATSALQNADRRLENLHRQLEERRKALVRGRSRDTEPLSAEELTDLSEAAALSLAEVRLLTAERAGEASGRTRSAESAASLLLPIRREKRVARRAAVLSDSFRLSRDSRRASEALAQVAGTPADALAAASLRLRIDTAGLGSAADRLAVLRGPEAATPTVLGPETEFVSALILSRLAVEARSAGRADLADRLLGRLRRDVDRAVAAHGGPWAARAKRLATLAGRSAGLPQNVAAAVERAEALTGAGSPEAPAAHLAAARLVLDAEVEPALRFALAERAAAQLRAARPRATEAAANREAAIALLRDTLGSLTGPAGEPSDAAASAHLLLASLLADRYDAEPTSASHRALAEALEEHRTRFAGLPSAAAATWRLARHEEVRNQRSQAAPLYTALLDDPQRGPAAAAALARCHEGVLRWLDEEGRRASAAGNRPVALARTLQRAQRRALAVAELAPLAAASLAEGSPGDDTPPLLAATRAELQLRTARTLLDGFSAASDLAA
ncbi:MAG: hypothetical protein AAF907_02655, partial [Planctomycetota bacterium]